MFGTSTNAPQSALPAGAPSLGFPVSQPPSLTATNRDSGAPATAVHSSGVSNAPVGSSPPAAGGLGFGKPVVNAGGSIKASAAAASASASAPPATPTYMALFARACRDGVVNDAFTDEIKKRFSAPMEVTVAPETAPQILPTALQTGAQWQAAVAPQAALTTFSITSSAPTAVAGATYSTLARGNEPQQQQDRRRLQVEQASEFLQTLLLCDSGYNNNEAPPPDNPASSQWTESMEEVKGLHAAVATVAVSAASNLISFLKTSIMASNQGNDGDATASSLFLDNRRKRTGQNPVLLAAQCLYVLSRHFQLTASVLNEALGLMDALYQLLKNSLRNRIVPLSTFSDNLDTCCLNTLTWLCVFSVVNMAAVWKKLRSSTGELQVNQLIHSSAAASIGSAVTALRRKLHESVQVPSTSGSGGLYGDVLTESRRGVNSRAATSLPAAVYTWQVLIDSYLSILTLTEGCLLRANGSEQGYDKALDAFLGARMASLSSPHTAATQSGVWVHRGKVTKRMVELAPVPRTLSIPLGLLYLAPYEIMSYLFDEMLPLLRHLSELEVATHRRYCEQLEELPRLPSLRRSSSGGNPSAGMTAPETHYVYQQRDAAQKIIRGEEKDGEEAWLRRPTRTGAATEVIGEPFTSEMAHLLEALAICLQHLPPDVLNPDLDSDCAATFFIFQNFVKHMRQVFATQRNGTTSAAGVGGAVWENYTLKLMTRFLEVMAMIGRNPQYTQRVVVLLTDAQTECNELQWPSLVNQALECAGFNSAVVGAPGAVGSDGTEASATMFTAPVRTPSVGPVMTGATDGDDMHALLSTAPGTNGVARALHQQFTRAYTVKCQRHYIASFFLLLRQLFAHPTLQPIVSTYMNLALALTFLSAPQQSQMMLGSTLSLISSLIKNAADAQLVWSFLEQRRLLQQPLVRTRQQMPEGSPSPSSTLCDRFSAAASFPTAAGQRGPTAHEEALSLIGHCQYECTQGTYDITVGFLNLVTALFQRDQPSMVAMPVYSTVTHFIAQEILRGVLKRMFARPHERYTVVALACAALRQALLVRFRSTENGGTAVLPFATIMAINKAPTDVVGEVLKVILDASDAPHELLSHHRAAVRQAMRLLITSIQAVREQNIEMLLFDNRTTLNTDLAVRVLGMCSPQDTLLTKTTLQLLLLLPIETANQAAHYWSGLTHKYTAVLDCFAQLLHPLNTVSAVVQAPPELAQLDFEPSELVPGWSAAMLTETKSLLLDLLMQHADVTEPSLTAWMAGFYGEELSRRDRRGQQFASMHGGTTGGNGAGGEPRWWRTTLLTSVVEGACDYQVERVHPALAVKYVKLLYLLRANRLYGSLVIRPFLESVCQTLFLRLQHYRPSQSSPVALSKYAYVLKLLALEACYAYRTAPESLRLAQNTTTTSIPVEVLLSLLYPSGSSTGALAGSGAAAPSAAEYAATENSGARSLYEVDGYHGETRVGALTTHRDLHKDTKQQWCGDLAVMSRDAAVDITSWLPEALHMLPTFPEKLPEVTGGVKHLVRAAADGVVQYNMTSLYGAIQDEQVRANQPPLTMAELRDRLRPFIAANDCFFSYAAGVSFVEGWCQLVSVSCSVVTALSVPRLRSFALCILRGLDATTRLTAAAQEQVTIRLCHCLSTVMAHLRQIVCASVALSRSAPQPAEGGAAWYDQSSGDYPGVQGGDGVPLDAARAAPCRYGGCEPCIASSAPAPPVIPTTVPPYKLDENKEFLIGRRRPRASSRHAALQYRSGQGGAVIGNTNNVVGKPFATAAGELSNFYSAANRSKLAQALLHRRDAGRSSVENEQNPALATWHPPGSADTLSLLEPLVRALVQWGTRIPSTRGELYLSLLCLAETPGVNLDDVAIWRFQRSVLDVVCTDICGSSSGVGTAPSACGGSERIVGIGAAAALNSNRHHSTTHGKSSGSGSSSGAAALSTQAQQAVTLLVALLQASAPIRDEFCKPDAGGGDGLGKWALRCATALLQSADHAVCNFFTSNGAQLGTLLWHLRSAFDVVSVISLGHGSQVLHSNLLNSCFAMRAWKYSTLVALGYSQPTPTFHEAPSRALVEQNKEALRYLLLGVVRWVNVLFSSLGDAAPLLYEVQKFIRDNRQLIDHVFIAPASVSSAISGPTSLSASHLTLCAELSDCLRALSSSVLAVDCRQIVDDMALAELLSMLSSDEVWHSTTPDLYGFADNDGGEGGMGGAAGVVPMASPAAAAAAAAVSPEYHDTNPRENVKGSLGKVPVAIDPAAERGRDVVALTVRNLAHLLLNTEYGQRNSEDPGASIAYADNTPMLRHTAEKRQLVARIVRHIAQSLLQTSLSEVREFRLECYLYALHAMVCLLHSFVLPLAPAGPLKGQSTYPTSVPEEFVRYLSELPLGEFADTLTQAREAVYQLRDFNTDYRGGLRGNRVAPNTWVISASSAVPHTLSDSARIADSGTPDQKPKVSLSPATGHVGGSGSDTFTVPSTPGLLPSAEAHRGGCESGKGSQATSRFPAAAELGQTFSGRLEPHASHLSPSTAASYARGTRHDPTMTVAFDVDGSSSHLPNVQAQGGANACIGTLSAVGDSQSSLLHATDDGAKLNPDVTLRELLPQRGRADEEEWTRLYDSATAHDVSGAVADGDLDSTGIRSAPLQWKDLLNVENEVRQVKIAIANALRATNGAIKIVQKNV
ncbi:hypothetical protein JKF63_01747 [Porcisia hertigi]|uniref:Uncharacterized protein n=1 Tax=Porcisia hertigi TaxID=2761500 RepID=A0A836IEV2_9TRYP|nr:hypothetical protein JKF63_01747 [Porcisia hertigi]